MTTCKSWYQPAEQPNALSRRHVNRLWDRLTEPSLYLGRLPKIAIIAMFAEIVMDAMNAMNTMTAMTSTFALRILF